MQIRAVNPSEVPALRALYADAVRSAGPAGYSEAQLRAWSAFAGEDGFEAFVLGVDTFVAVRGGRIEGFCGIADDGHVASIYVHGRCMRQGIGGALLDFALATHPAPSYGRYYAEASLLSLPLFQSRGFRLVGTETTQRGGVAFQRHLVEKVLKVGDTAR